MMIVATGLILIVVRIVSYRSNAWLISANLSMLLLTIYVCSFVNFASLVANYNVSRSLDVSKAGLPIDLSYLVGLGPQAIPALDRYIASQPQQPLGYFRQRRDWLATYHKAQTRDWRAFTVRGWRLTLYLRGFRFNQP